MKTLILIFLSLCFWTINEKSKVIERPECEVNNTDNVFIDKIEISDTSTVFYMTYLGRPKSWFSYSSQTYLKAGKEKYTVIESNGIELDQRANLGEQGNLSFTLTFPPISMDVETIDLIEGEGKNDFKIWGIDIDLEKIVSVVKLPSSVRHEARNIKEDDKSLPVPVLKEGNAIVSGQLIEYRPELDYTMELYVNNPITGKQEQYKVNIENDGSFKSSFPLITTMEVLFRITPNLINDYVLFSPGEETGIYIDLNAKSNYRPKSWQGQKDINRWLYFTGANAEINNQIHKPEMRDYFQNFRNYNKMLDDIYGMTLKEYKDYWLQKKNKAIDGLEEIKLTKKAKKMAALKLEMSTLHELMFATYNLEQSYKKKHNIKDREEMKGFIPVKTTKEYYDFLKDKPFNDSILLYSAYAGNVVNSAKYINAKRFTISVNAQTLQLFRDNNSLSSEEKELVEYLIKEQFENWEKKRVKLEKNRVKTMFTKFKETNKLTENEIKEVNKLIELCEKKENNIAEILDTQIGLYFQILQNERYSQSEIDAIEAEVERKYKPYVNKKEIAQERVSAFNENNKEEFSKLMKIVSAKERRDNLASILGTDKSFALDLIQTQLLSKNFQQNSPLEDIELQGLKEMENQFYFEYLKSKNEDLIAKIEENKKTISYFVREVPEVGNEELLSQILERYKGKIVFVDFWATWCAPCRSAMDLFKDDKSKLKDKEIVFVYITDHTSPLKIWENMISGIDGEHYRLTNEQFSFLRQQLGISGVPSYMIANKEGEQVYFQVGFRQTDIINTINKELK